ncbi:MAG: tRNA uridine-5-carboxymethylaminomethyl(34) synthesis GTPase MnmE [Bacteroidales bacterium]|nr:tRNA uridine-5-carboxymethylaminomethyl(34) synthesis GTPase MnmE [Bacteroidales bacterium]
MNDDTIAAIASSPGSGAIAIIRLSGSRAIEITDQIFYPKNKKKKIIDQDAYTVHYGLIKDQKEIIDEVLVSVFRAPRSYTGEDSIEISCHGSLYIQQRILNLLIKTGARTASPGEFTQRAFLNGKLDLSQAEAVADLIASESAAAHKVAFQQMRGGFTSDLKDLRSQLLFFISLIELELDFSEEDVEFADRAKLQSLILTIKEKISELLNSFELGNVIKKGIPVAIVGEPNVGKSTLLNVLLNEDKAIVSEIAGTTRDAVEDVISLSGILFRFIDTAGLRKTDDAVESLGIERTIQKIENAEIVLFMIDAKDKQACEKVFEIKERAKDKKLILVVNKIDKSESIFNEKISDCKNFEIVQISAKHKQNINVLTETLLKTVHYSPACKSDTIITNTRHFELLQKAYEATLRVDQVLTAGISGDFLAQDIREILNFIGEITGEFTTDEVLGNIFDNFCIGK